MLLEPRSLLFWWSLFKAKLGAFLSFVSVSSVRDASWEVTRNWAGVHIVADFTFSLLSSLSFASLLLRLVRWNRIVVPDEGYLANVHELCKKHNVLLICDEIQTVRLHLFLFSPPLFTHLT